MRKLLMFFFVSTLFLPYIFPQEGDHINGGVFLKSIEYNRRGWIENWYNIERKEEVEQLFYGRYNAPVEFLFEPSVEYCRCYDGPSGFRILIDSVRKAYVLEVKYITNFKEAGEAAERKFPTGGSSSSIFGSRMGEKSLTSDEIKILQNQREELWKKRMEERVRHYNIEEISLAVSDRFAGKLYHQTVSFIDNFRAKGANPLINDGYQVFFRAVVGDEFWLLNIHMPVGKALKVAKIYKQILEDVKNDKFEEEKFIKLIDDL